MSPERSVKLRASPLVLPVATSGPRSPKESQEWRTPRNPEGFADIHNFKHEDPYLAQYVKLPNADLQQLFFLFLQKQIGTQGLEFYQPYLKQHGNSLSPEPARVHKADSPLKHHVVLRDSFEESNDPTTAPLDTSTDVIPMEIVESTQELPVVSRRRSRPVAELPLASVKKLHPQVEVQTLLREFKECPTPVLVKLITRMLQSLINLNDRNVPAAISNPMAVSDKPAGEVSPDRKNKLLTRYHSRTPPAISIDTYISRLVKFNNFTQANLLLTIYYIDLLSHNFQPYFTLNSWTVHRFLLVATMLAQKALEDFFYTNDHYAKVGGVALTELNCLELDFLNRVNWRVVPAKQLNGGRTSIQHSKEVLDMYYWQLITLMGKNVTEQNNVVYVFEELQPQSRL